MSIISLENVSRHFDGVPAVDGVTLAIEPGEFVTLLGPSGCGKTTTLRIVAGLEQNTGGRVRIEDEIVSDAEEGFFLAPERRRLGMVFQSYAIWPHMTVFDNVAYPLRIRRQPAHLIEERVRAALRLVEMERYADRPAPALSGGQQQRVAIARALVFEPQVLLLDEPLSNLDARLRTQMGDEFRALQKRLGITSLYVTHDQAEAMSLSDRVVVMHAGKILQIGTPEEIYRRPSSKAVASFFGSPNLLTANVRDCRRVENAFMLHVEAQGWTGRCHSAAPARAGEPIVVMVRPENIRVETREAANSSDMIWSGRVVESIFRGTHRSVVIETDVARLRVEASALEDVRVGHSITVAAQDGAAWALHD
jgi:iron(III) transport system ATP-binding protein